MVWASSIQSQKLLAAKENFLQHLKKELDHEMQNEFKDNAIERTLEEIEFDLNENYDKNYMELKKENKDFIFLIQFESRKPKKLPDEEDEDLEENNGKILHHYL